MMRKRVSCIVVMVLAITLFAGCVLNTNGERPKEEDQHYIGTYDSATKSYLDGILTADDGAQVIYADGRVYQIKEYFPDCILVSTYAWSKGALSNVSSCTVTVTKIDLPVAD